MSYRFVWPPADRFIKIWLGIYVGFFIFNTLAHAIGLFSSFSVWSLSWSQITELKIWTILSYWSVSLDLLEVLFNGLLFWFIGGELYALWGQKRFCYFLAVCILGAGCGYLVMDILFGPLPPLYGPHSVSTALILIYAFMYPDRELFLLFFPVKGRYFCMILLGMEAFRFLQAPSKLNYLGHLLGASLGILWWWMSFRRGPRGPWSKNSRAKNKKLSLIKTDNTTQYWQ
ncbi:MAG: rhomboid family intramembrane serine protease [Bdellovibrio sp.]|nr:rhomboid family intramembrane serine protease [Bdellovibrio sp.]